MNIRHAFIYVLFLCLPVTIQADVETQLHTLLQQYVTAVNELDLVLAEKIFSQKEDISFIHPRGHQKGWKEIRKDFFLDGMGQFSKRNLRLRDISIRIIAEDAAWADFYWDFDAVFPDGKPLSSSGRETQLWKKEPEGWKIVHVHYSGPPIQREGEGF